MAKSDLKSRRALLPGVLTLLAAIWKGIVWAIGRGGDVDFLLSLPGRNWDIALDWLANHGFWVCFCVGVGWLLFLAFRPEPGFAKLPLHAGKNEPEQAAKENTASHTDDAPVLNPTTSYPIHITRPSLYRSGAQQTRYRGPKPAIHKSVHELLEPLTGRTDREAHGYIKSKIGNWLPISGTVGNVWEQYSKLYIAIASQLFEPNVYCEFSPSAGNTVDHLSVGDPIHVIGRIQALKRTGIDLEECEVLYYSESTSAGQAEGIAEFASNQQIIPEPSEQKIGLLNAADGVTRSSLLTASTVSIRSHAPSVDWGLPAQPEELTLRLVNRGNAPLVGAAVDIVGLELWHEGQYREDSRGHSIRVVHNATVDPEPHASRKHTLIRHKGNHFHIQSPEPPHKYTTRETGGIWRVSLQIEDQERSIKIGPFYLFFSWKRDRKPPLRIEQDPEG